ncbi:LysR family transcriptional regulator [Geomicrobium sp. JCM 19039]|uniref:LysR family transcriptional regulator n=1 Tax=Geomicrobium sp. JCM 19039 TaxID=1460636 RepID=UPI0009E042A2|nr:LysR family transcriptional regulator [Geomicrobium sp. JCM 19039]
MEIRHVRYFVTVVQEGQITTAAQKLNMAQPPLSQQIRRLEKELGTQLLVRVGKKFLPTEAGELLYERGIELLKEFDDVVDIVKDTGEGLRGTLQIGCVKSCFIIYQRPFAPFMNSGQMYIFRSCQEILFS